MFSKTKTPAPPLAAAEPMPALPDCTPISRRRRARGRRLRRPAKAASMLAADLTFEGNLIGSGDLHIEGTVRGDVKVGRLTVGETGNVEGGIQADDVEIRGRVVGAVTGKQVKLVGTAFVDGDISHENLSIDVGAYFQGRCLQSRKVEPPVSSQRPPRPPSASPPQPPRRADTGQLIELKPASA